MSVLAWRASVPAWRVGIRIVHVGVRRLWAPASRVSACVGDAYVGMAAVRLVRVSGGGQCLASDPV
ncbi:hypothetical protein AB0392_06565 [Nonomuraea angiospora]|uniref:hypothetical protein n=1 Tax=Nonomuraea angiospora TaxID=46172 RepID=UPI00344F5E50